MKQLRFTIRTMLLAVFGLSVMCGLVASIRRLRLTHDVVSENHWPSELRDLLAKLPRDNAFAHSIDVRSAGLMTEYCWAMPATEQAVSAHVDRFNLEHVGNSGVEVQRIHDRFPLAWTWPKHQEIECWASPVGLPGANEGEFEFVLLHDKIAKRLFFYYYFNF